MSLLSRFRKTVLPSSSRNKKLVDDDVRHYNYRKPTKSFNEKSVKSKNSTTHYTDSNPDNNNHRFDGQGKNVRGSSKLSRTSTSSVQQSANKNKTNSQSSANNATLSRSNTFTLDEEEQFQNVTHPKFQRKDKYNEADDKKYHYRQVGTDNGKANSNVSKDVFESFYSKRALRSSHSSKSSNDSIRGADDTTPTLNKPNPCLTHDRPAYAPAKIYKYDSPAKSLVDFDNGNRSEKSEKSEKSKPRQYLFGSTFSEKNKDEPEKENIYANADSTNSDRFKTITINSLRRSFRDSFLDSTKPAKGREHQPLWFIDANGDKEQSKQFESNNKPMKQSTKLIDSTTDPHGNRHQIKIKRNETFRVDKDENPLRSKPSTALERRETFRVNHEQLPVRDRERLRTLSADSNNSYSLTTNKVIPVAVTSPYNSLNDIDGNIPRKIFTRKNRSIQPNNKYNNFDENENDKQNFEYSDDKRSSQEFSSSHDNSPLRHDKHIKYDSKPNKMLIEFKSTDKPSYEYNYANSGPFEKRSTPERKSCHDFNNDTIDWPRAHRSYTSLRSKLEKPGSNLRRKPISNSYDEVYGSTDNLAKPYKMCSNKPTDAWRRISTRQFNNNESDTENRSFVPYRNKFDTYDRSKSKNSCNRTTININYNYNMNAANKKEPSIEMKSNNEYDMPTLVNKSTSAIKSNSGKDKSNKNRSVNFPSVECEVRLISPNYDTKPRRKESWKSKPSNDWTFNKDIIIKEIVNGTECTECKHLCPGFEPHSWRKTCLACKCPREKHAIYQEQLTSVKERLGFKPSTNITTLDAQQLGYTWIPPGIMTANKIRQYFELLPDDKVPKFNTIGEEYRAKQLSYQWPKQDLALTYCKHIEPQNNASYEDFVAGRNEIALDIAYIKDVTAPSICVNCDENMKPGDLTVIAPKFREQMLWHPKCFTCSTCDELLVDLTYCVHDDKIYCERHYAELLKPRCNSCDELIFSGEYTKAMNKDWHSGHFCCWQCDESLTGQRYVLRDDHPYCIKCYENVFANTCDECNKIIGIDSKDLSYKEKHWHEACFLCNKCRVSLVDKQFGSKAEKIYCGNCYDSQFASRCDGCGEVFRAGTKKMEYKTRQWHEKCFACCVCKNPIGTKSFIPREQEIYCAGCYEEKYATRCVKCSKIITSGGVTYKNDPWHRECFTCTHCSTSLAGQRFTSRDDKPYCAECFGELFAKRCTACTKPITGIGGTRFISFEDRHWHNDCFICASCKTSLVGRGFITDEADIICPECAKAKLM